MTIATTIVQTSGSLGNSSNTVFSFSFPIDDYGSVDAEDQIQVILETVATGAETILTRTTHYTVSVNGDQTASPGGSITTVSTYSSAYRIWIRSNPSFLQSTDYQNQGGFLMETVEDQADQHSRQILLLKDAVRRAPRVGVQAGTSFDGEITGDITPGYIPQINSEGTGYTLVANNGSSTLVTPTGATAAQTLADRAALSYYAEDFGAVADLTFGDAGVATATDATFTDAGAAFTAADIGKYIVVHRAGTAGAAHKTTIASINSATSIEMAAVAVTTVASSAKYLYGTDNSAAIQAALDALGASEARGVLRLPGMYGVASQLTLPTGVTIEGALTPGYRDGRNYMEDTRREPYGSRIVALASMTSVIYIADTTNQDARYGLRDIVIDANGSATRAISADWAVQSVCRLVVQNVHFVGAVADNIYLANVLTVFLDNYISSLAGGKGVYLGSGVADSVFRDGYVHVNAGDGFYCANGGYNLISGGKIEDNRGAGVYVYTGSVGECTINIADVVLSGNSLEGVYTQRDSGSTNAQVICNGVLFVNNSRSAGGARQRDARAVGANARLYLNNCHHVGSDVEYLWEAATNAKIFVQDAAVRGEPTIAREFETGGGIVYQSDVNDSGVQSFPAGISFDSGTNVLDAFTATTSFTPTVSFATNGDFSPTYTTQVGRYWKIGKLVYFVIELDFTTNAYTTAAGALNLDGLPFSAASGPLNYPATLGIWDKVSLAGGRTELVAYVQATVARLRFNMTGTGVTATGVTISNIPASTANFKFQVSGMYIAA